MITQVDSYITFVAFLQTQSITNWTRQNKKILKYISKYDTTVTVTDRVRPSVRQVCGVDR